MASLYTKVKLYLEANGKSSNEIGSPSQNANVQILHEGDISSINVWNVSGLAKPNDSQLESYDSNGDTEETNNTVRNTRKKNYGDIGDQLDEIYKDIDSWKTRIKSIKDANPKS